MWPAPLVSTPRVGCQAGPSPPAPLPASTLSLPPGAKMASSAVAADARDSITRVARANRMLRLRVVRGERRTSRLPFHRDEPERADDEQGEDGVDDREDPQLHVAGVDRVVG